MALADPQVVTINTVDNTCARVEPGTNKSVYATSDETLKMTVSHQKTKGNRTRHMVRLDKRVIASDPLTSINEYKDLGVYVVIDQPDFGFTDGDIDNVIQGLFGHLDTTLATKVLGGEH